MLIGSSLSLTPCARTVPYPTTTVQADRCVYVWSYETGKLEYRLPGHAGECIVRVAFCCSIFGLVGLGRAGERRDNTWRTPVWVLTELLAGLFVTRLLGGMEGC